MPPTAFEYVGGDAVAEALRKAVFRDGARSFVLLRTWANGGRPAFGIYAADRAAGPGSPARGLGVMVLTVRDGAVSGFDTFVFFGGPNRLPRFGLPPSLPGVVEH